MLVSKDVKYFKNSRVVLLMSSLCLNVFRNPWNRTKRKIYCCSPFLLSFSFKSNKSLMKNLRAKDVSTITNNKSPDNHFVLNYKIGLPLWRYCRVCARMGECDWRQEVWAAFRFKLNGRDTINSIWDSCRLSSITSHTSCVLLPCNDRPFHSITSSPLNKKTQKKRISHTNNETKEEWMSY